MKEHTEVGLGTGYQPKLNMYDIAQENSLILYAN